MSNVLTKLSERFRRNNPFRDAASVELRDGLAHFLDADGREVGFMNGDAYEALRAELERRSELQPEPYPVDWTAAVGGVRR